MVNPQRNGTCADQRKHVTHYDLADSKHQWTRVAIERLGSSVRRKTAFNYHANRRFFNGLRRSGCLKLRNGGPTSLASDALGTNFQRTMSGNLECFSLVFRRLPRVSIELHGLFGCSVFRYGCPVCKVCTGSKQRFQS